MTGFQSRSGIRRHVVTIAAILTLAGGCHSVPTQPYTAVKGSDECVAVPTATIPRELSKVVLPAYVIGPPDILMIGAIHVVPRAPYHMRAMDMLMIQVSGTLPDSPIFGKYMLEPGGVVQFGPPYGGVQIEGMVREEAEAVITRHLQAFVKNPRVFVQLVETAAKQQIAGQHLVGPDGTVTLGNYGSVSVVGRTVDEARSAIEAHLAQYLDHPEVSVNIFAYNSMVYYVITQGAGLGDGVFRFPVTGNDTVLDAISNVNGIDRVSSKKIWIARPTDVPGAVQILPVSWEEITAQASACSNYQIMPGDRVFIAEDKWVALDTQIAKLTAPIERVMGFSLLGAGTVTRFSGSVLRGGGNPQSNF